MTSFIMTHLYLLIIINVCVSVFVFQQLLSLQEKLTHKQAELEQAREEHRCLEGEMLSLRDKVCAQTTCDRKILC